MGFLKALGKSLQIVGQFVLPILGVYVKSTPDPKDDAVFDTASAVIGEIIRIEAAAEAIADKNLSGADKLRMATPVCLQYFTLMVQKMGLKIADVEAFKASGQQAISGFVGMFNACKKD